MINNFRQVVIAMLVLAALTLFGVGFQAQESGDGSLKLWVLDVGQGDAILIDTPDHYQILIDGGPNEAVLAQLAKALPATDKELDLVISTHNDADHLAGLNEVLRHYKVDKIWVTGAVHPTNTYRTFLALISKMQIPTETVLAGKTLEIGGLKGIVISPFESLVGVTPTRSNAAGIVTYWQYNKITWLLTADVEQAQEQIMLQRGVVRPVEILKIAHHGSKTSSSQEFLAATSPEVAVISAGRNNQYGHPHPSVLERLSRFSGKILRTDELGPIQFSIFPDRYSYQSGS